MPLLYKFRPLATCVDFLRLTKILKEKLFWFSPLWEQNDSMEAVYKSGDISAVSELKIPIAKMRKRICSFSSASDVTNPIEDPLMWAHYASGFKGLVIEIEPDQEVEVHPVKYHTDPTIIPMELRYSITKIVNNIITSKSVIWNTESEWRVIKEVSAEDEKTGISGRVGEIKTIVIGKPYALISNRNDIYSASTALQSYRKRALNIIDMADSVC